MILASIELCVTSKAGSGAKFQSNFIMCELLSQFYVLTWAIGNDKVDFKLGKSSEKFAFFRIT